MRPFPLSYSEENIPQILHSLHLVTEDGGIKNAALLLLQELKCLPDMPVYYYTKPNAKQEIDFMIMVNNQAIPIEAKAGENLQAKSLKQYIIENSPAKAIKTSLMPFKSNEIIDNVPLYAIANYVRLMGEK